MDGGNALITEQYKDQIQGVLFCFDRVIIRGTLINWGYPEGMASFLNYSKVLLFDYPVWSKTLNEEVRQNAENLATENGIKIEFIRKIREVRKEDQVKAIIEKRGSHPGLVAIFSVMEQCAAYQPWRDSKTGNTSLRRRIGKCLNYYFYFIDKLFGLCYLRVPTWCPFHLQFYFNGHNWLAANLTKRSIAHTMHDNAFLNLADFSTAQELSDKIRVADLHQILDILAQRCCPFVKTFSLTYNWSLVQVEYATDIIFRKQTDLKLLYEPLIRSAIIAVKPENVATFLGAKLHMNYQGEIGNNFNTRLEGTRISHHMGANAIKMYDKFSLILRIETTVNDVTQFKTFREVDKKTGKQVKEMANMKTSIYSLFPLVRLLKAANFRYLAFISAFPDPGNGVIKLTSISRTIESGERSYKGFNFFAEDDQTLFSVIARGEFNINGFRNQSLRSYFVNKSPAQISRILKRLRLHGLIKKVGHTFKYYLTILGKQVATLGLRLKELLIIPGLAGFKTVSI
jgi:hypothetical protein